MGYLKGERVQSVCVRGVFNVQLWWLMHRALLGDFSRSRAAYAGQLLLTHPFGLVARRWRRGPFYRYLVVAEIGQRASAT